MEHVATRAGHAAARAVLALTALLSVLALTGAGPAQAAGTPPGASWVRAVHLLPGAAQMQVSLAPADGGTGAAVLLTDSFAYGQSTDYRAVPPGVYTVDVRPLGSAPSDPPLLSSTYTAATGGAASLAVLGNVDAPRLAVLQDDLTPPAAGQVRVRVLPAASSATQVTVQADNGPTIAADAAFGQPTPYGSVPAGPWQLSARTASGLTGADTVELTSGAIYTLLVLDGPDGSLQLTTLEDAAGTAVSPAGGVATGAGGAADLLAGTRSGGPLTSSQAVGGLAGALLLTVGVRLLQRRRPTQAAVARTRS